MIVDTKKAKYKPSRKRKFREIRRGTVFSASTEPRLGVTGIAVDRRGLMFDDFAIYPIAAEQDVVEWKAAIKYGKKTIPRRLGQLAPGSVFRVKGREDKHYSHGMVCVGAWVYWLHDTSLISLINPEIEVEWLPEATIILK